MVDPRSPAPGPPPGPRPTPVHGSAIAGVVMAGLWICGLGSFVGLLAGYKAKREIDESNGRLGGRGIAVASIVLGWGGLALTAVAIFLAVLVNVLVPRLTEQQQYPEGDRSRLATALTNAAAAQDVYATTHGEFASSVPELNQEDLSVPTGVGLSVTTSDPTSYCMEAWMFDSEERMHLIEGGEPVTGPCP